MGAVAWGELRDTEQEYVVWNRNRVGSVSAQRLRSHDDYSASR